MLIKAILQHVSTNEIIANDLTDFCLLAKNVFERCFVFLYNASLFIDAKITLSV